MLDLEILSAGIADLIAPVLERLEDAEREIKELRAMPAPVQVVGALIDRDGALVLTYSNGETKSLGPVVGKNGDPGVDGLGFDDLSFSIDDQGRAQAVFARGEEIKSFSLPSIVYRGVFEKAADYLSGDAVTYGGSLWIASKAAPSGLPGDNGSDWRLAVKRGRDGKSIEGRG